MSKRIFLLLMIGIVSGFSVMTYMVTHAFFTDSAVSSSNTFTTAAEFPGDEEPATPSGQIVINEIMWAGSQGNSADEWIELRNMTGSTVDLTGWVVENLGEGSGASANIAITSGIIPANGFFLISNDTEANSVISVTPDFQTSSVSLNNNGEQLVLRNSASGIVIDTANINDDWFEGDDPPGQSPKKSMERNDTPGDGTSTGNWHTATAAVNIDSGEGELATPKATNSPIGP